jgi:hypothetical protein
MGYPAALIRSVSTPEYGRICIDASDGNCYHADLSSFSSVYRYPRDLEAWSQVSIDSYGLGLLWASRFEVHVDQILGMADRVERLENVILRAP